MKKRSEETPFRSMTGFGRTSLTSPSGQFLMEVQCVNRKHLELIIQLPKGFTRFEQPIRKWLEKGLHRGQILVNLQWTSALGKNGFQITPNLPLAERLAEAWKSIEKAASLTLDPSLLFCQQKDLFSFQESPLDDQEILACLEQLCKDALEKVIEERRREGKELALDIKKRLECLKEELEKIALRAPSLVEKFRERLKQKIEEFLSNPLEHEERILREIVIFADKGDITEEIVRAKGHIEQCFRILESPQKDYPEGVGKQFEFLVQEIQRESNTIAAKVGDLECAQSIVLIKTELEKVREQLQNIE